jgi:hypothetical protein
MIFEFRALRSSISAPSAGLRPSALASSAALRATMALQIKNGFADLLSDGFRKLANGGNCSGMKDRRFHKSSVSYVGHWSRMQFQFATAPAVCWHASSERLGFVEEPMRNVGAWGTRHRHRGFGKEKEPVLRPATTRKRESPKAAAVFKIYS